MAYSAQTSTVCGGLLRLIFTTRLADPQRELRDRMRALAAHTRATANTSTVAAPKSTAEPDLDQIAQTAMMVASEIKPRPRRCRLYHKSIVDSSLVRHEVLKHYLANGDTFRVAADIAGNAAANAFPLDRTRLLAILREINDLRGQWT